MPSPPNRCIRAFFGRAIDSRIFFRVGADVALRMRSIFGDFRYICRNLSPNGGFFIAGRTCFETLLRPYGARRRVARHPARFGLRTAGAQRRGKDDAHPHRQPHYGARRRAGALRRTASRVRRRAAHRLPARGARPLQEDEGGRAGALFRTAQRAVACRGAACGCGSTGSTSRRGGTVASRSCRREWRRRYSSSSRCCTNPNC